MWLSHFIYLTCVELWTQLQSIYFLKYKVYVNSIILLSNLISFTFMNNDCNMVMNIFVLQLTVLYSQTIKIHTYSHKKPFLKFGSAYFASKPFVFENETSFITLQGTTWGMKKFVYSNKTLKIKLLILPLVDHHMLCIYWYNYPIYNANPVSQQGIGFYNPLALRC
jgi:hypothetical protein